MIFGEDPATYAIAIVLFAESFLGFQLRGRRSSTKDGALPVYILYRHSPYLEWTIYIIAADQRAVDNAILGACHCTALPASAH